MTEAEVTKESLLALSKNRLLKLFRNQVGEYKLADGRHIRSGLCIGSSDYIGWLTKKVTPDMVGKPVAIFTAIEFKANPKAKKTTQQAHFIETVKKAGGIAGFVSSVTEATKLIEDEN